MRMTTSDRDADLTIAGERVHLLPERALYWPKRETLFVADLHIGKAAAFRASGHGIPRGTTTADLDRLSSVLRRTQAGRLVILGDLYHARAGQVDATMSVLRKWRNDHPRLEVGVVRGNHDARSNPSPPDLGFEEVGSSTFDDPFVLTHHPASSNEGYVLAGHIHPGYTLRGIGGEKMRLACFHVGTKMTVLPAFGSFTGVAAITPGNRDRVFVIADEIVFEVPAS
jgi:uncharacterized protein